MRTKDEIQNAVGNILKQLRTDSNLTQAEMAAKFFLEAKTYARYERGETSPTLPAFIEMLDGADAPVLPVIKKYLYPEQYSGSSQDLRQRLSDHILRYASDREIEQMLYIMDGHHGSPREAQIQLFTAFDHLPMADRLIAAKTIYQLWELEAARGSIINEDSAMPDMELLHAALVSATRAVIEGRTNYSTGIK